MTKKAEYRLYVLSLLPQLKVLDFQKVKDKERDLAKQRFGDGSGMAEETTFEPEEEVQQAEAKVGCMGITCALHCIRDHGYTMLHAYNTPQAKAAAMETEANESKGPTPEQITAIKAAIANASTLEVGCWVCGWVCGETAHRGASIIAFNHTGGTTIGSSVAGW